LRRGNSARSDRVPERFSDQERRDHGADEDHPERARCLSARHDVSATVDDVRQIVRRVRPCFDGRILRRRPARGKARRGR
jgi:hypothetical protein